MKKIFKLLLMFAIYPCIVFGNNTDTSNIKMSGTYTIGESANADYSSLTLALAFLQVSGATGPVIFELDNDYNINNEVFPVTILDFSGSSDVNTLTIRPASNVTLLFEKAVYPSMFYISGASNIIIDGSNNGSDSKNLTLSNPVTQDTSSVIVIDSGSYNITVKNCIISGSSKDVFSCGIFSVEGNNVTIQNNEIKKTQIGIYSFGDDLYAANNIIGADNVSESIDFGISCWNGNNAIIDHNKIFNIVDDNLYNYVGNLHAVSFYQMTGVVELKNNFIDSIVYTSNDRVVQAIALLDCITNEFYIINNRISNIASNGTLQNFPASIAISSAGSNMIIIANNSINIPENNQYGLGGTTNNIVFSAIAMDEITDLVFTNNIISNNLGRKNGSNNIVCGTIFTFAFYQNPFLLCDYNLYTVGGDYTLKAMALTTNGFMNFDEWKVFIEDDSNSYFDKPICFKSNDSLQLLPCSYAIARGIYYDDLNTDIDGNPRNAIYPSMGAYEYGIVQASNVFLSIPVKSTGFGSFTKGNGKGRVVFIKRGNVLPDTPFPTNGTTYNANNTLGHGDEIGSSGWYCVVNDTVGDEYLEIYDTTDFEEVTLMVCEYFGEPGDEIYIIDTAYLNPNTGLIGQGDVAEEIQNNIIVSPNPSNGQIFINSQNIEIQRIIISDVSGKSICSFTSNNIQNIDLSMFSDGFYILNFYTNRGIISKNIILNK